jgi:tetratricopeptide (TPR) repeat protein
VPHTPLLRVGILVLSDVHSIEEAPMSCEVTEIGVESLRFWKLKGCTMKRALGILLSALAVPLLLCASTTFAQQGAQQEFGEVAFVNSGPAAAQADFLRGLAQLHNFEYDDAAEHFRKAQQIAPDFAMAYWGEAMTQNHPVWHEEDVPVAREILNHLGPTPEARIAKAATEREKLYLRSVETLFGEGTKDERDRRYESILAELHRKFPDDVDGSSFYALAILGTAEHGRDFATYMRAAAVLEEVFPQHPRHPGVVHYLIHCYDDSVHAPLGLRAARIYSKIAPEAGHAQHMTSHIFLSLGMWDDEVKANETAMAVVNKEREKAGRPHAMCGHYNEWLEYGYLQQGRFAEARRVLEGCGAAAEKAVAAASQAKSSSDHAGMSGMTPAMGALNSYAEMRAHFLICTQLWNDEVVRWTLPAGDYPIAESTFDYTNALAAIRRGDLAGAREGVSRVEKDGQRVIAWAEKQEMGAIDRHDPVAIYNGQLHALLAAAEGKAKEALAELQQVAEKEHKLPLEFGPPSIEKPTDELIGELLLQLHRPAEAHDAFQTALARAPGRKMVVESLARTDKEIAAVATAKPSTGAAPNNH